jgi:ABC-type transport system substrate-binding protein
MKHKLQSLLVLVSISMLVASCGSSGPLTVVDTPASTITSSNQSPVRTRAEMKVLKYGELDQIKSLDPLYALNPAAQRIVQLVHEGLTGLNAQGEISPRLAATWDVTSDSLTWLFTLRDDIFYHDATVFTSGIGRKVTARDVYNVFLRMASNAVPPDAARLFTGSIIGFDAYFREQNEIYFEQDRVISDIQGIRVVDDRTIQFNLNYPDPKFLQKLASPLAVVYPVEAFANKRSAEEGDPVGTGPFRFERAFGDTLFVLTRNKRYWAGSDRVRIDQIEVVNQRAEAELFKRFAREEIDFIAELGPEMIRTLINEQGSLEEAYTSTYELYKGHPQRFELNFNTSNAYLFNVNDALTLIRDFNVDTYVQQMGTNVVRVVEPLLRTPDEFVSHKLARFDTSRNVVNVSYTGNQIAGDFLLNVVQAAQKVAPVRIYRTPLVTREILFFMTQPGLYTSNGFMDEAGTWSAIKLLRFDMNRYAITNKKVRGIQMNEFSWWLDFANVVIQDEPS